tara:strand:+ start:567 stop:1364 length:798 start_codon:yes stop_codon:yes gene_type:complete
MQNLNQFLYEHQILLTDARGRKYLETLSPGGKFQCHLGFIEHQNIVGTYVGSWVTTSKNHLLFAEFPSFEDAVTLINRATQIIYPKDLALIISKANIQEGDSVIEAGLGSGILTSAILRNIGSKGHVTSYEINPSIIPLARANIATLTNGMENYLIKNSNINRCSLTKGVDSIILDLPEPWKILTKLSDSLKPGGRLLCFLPTILQVHKLTSALHDHFLFTSVETTETMQRQWHITKNSARPSHRMIGHTGFITMAIRCIPRHQD